MANKSTRLLLDALARAAAAPSGLPLFAGKTGPGLFPPTAVARQVAQRSIDDGFLSSAAGVTAAKPAREICTITEKGLHWLVTQANPRQVLEDFVRVIEERRGQIAHLVGTTQGLAAGLEALATAVERLRPQFQHPERNGHTPTAPEAMNCRSIIESLLAAWHAVEPGDCPLPYLYEQALQQQSKLTIGRFHDALRTLYDENRVWLHPWTGPLYQLPEPAYALLIGHEIAFYASLRNLEPAVSTTANSAWENANDDRRY